jgi:phytoene dehydrogenase-like protein
MRSSDAIVIGAGVNGLACALRLARGGMRVTVIEAAEMPGGMAAGHEFGPGFRTSGLAHLTRGLDSRLMRDADLGGKGLTFHPPLATTLVGGEGGPLVLNGASVTGAVDPGQAAAFATLHRRLTAFATALAPFRQMTPPRPSRNAGNEWARLGKLALGLRKLGRGELRELLRLILTNVADFAEDELTDPRLQGALAFDATLGAWLGPRSPNSLILMLDWLAQGPAALVPVGGVGAVAAALVRAAEGMGVALRLNTPVARIETDGERAVAVVLASGERLEAGLVVSSLCPQRTLLDLVGARHLDTGLATRTRHIRARGGAAKLHLALSAKPDFGGADPQSRIVIAPSVDVVETAFNPVKYGEMPEHPVIEVMLPSAFDAGLAPVGHHVLSAVVQFAPHAPRGGADAARAALLDRSLAVLDAHAPGLRASVLHAEMLMPQDIAARYGNTGGNWHHAELSVEQMLFLRPLPELARYATPVGGLWLCGAGMHPGGGVNGTAGWNAGEAIMREAGR